MATTYPLPTLAAVITAAGISAPSYDDILASLKVDFQTIYGADAYLEADSQDGQLLAIFAQAINDANQTAIAVYNSFAPSTAQGVSLSSVVKINKIRRKSASYSQVILTIAGVAGTVVTNGVVADDLGNKWLLPPSVSISVTGSVLVTAEAEQEGALGAPIGSITKILTPVSGWQTVTNATVAVPGDPVESDGELRRRQTISTALESYTVLNGIISTIANLQGVISVKGYENDTGSTDANGLPPHSVSMVVEGGDVNQIGSAILNKKGVGVATYGTTTVAVMDAAGILRNINFFVPTPKLIAVEVHIKALTGYVSTTGDTMKQALVDYINGLDIGDDVLITRLYLPALLNGDPLNTTYELVSVKAAISPTTPGTTDVVIGFHEIASADLAHVTLVVDP